MRLAAIAGTEETMSALPKHGRAAWVGERAIGIPDAGSVVAIRALEALEEPGVKPWDSAWGPRRRGVNAICVMPGVSLSANESFARKRGGSAEPIVSQAFVEEQSVL